MRERDHAVVIQIRVASVHRENRSGRDRHSVVAWPSVETTAARFASLVSPGEGSIAGDLDLGALLIADAVEPGVDIEHEQGRLDSLALESGASSAAALVEFLCETRGFAGDRVDYYNRQNSCLHRVLDRARGIPISLTVLAMEVGRRCGIPVDGIGMPGHFLARAEGRFIDVYGGGTFLDADGCAALLAEGAAGPVRLPPGALDPIAPADILRRMLLNLRLIAERENDTALLRRLLQLIAAFPDASVVDLLTLAQTEAALARFDRACAVAERALPALPEDRRDVVERQIVSWRARLN